MRKGGSICSTVLGLLCRMAQPGMTTKELAKIAEAEINKSGASASFLDYNGFPDVVCISVNDEVVHGVPNDKKVLQPGDIISFDLGITYGGMIVDSAKSIIVGQGNKQKQLLLKITEESLSSGLKQIKHNCRVGDISAAIEKVLSKHGYGNVRDLVGHGVGHNVHEEPNIPNFGRKGSGPQLKSGMTIAIEPMATLGGHSVFIDKDGWAVKTKDGSVSAHFEHTVLITNDGYEVLTSV
ncbi:type I methionyl aminopeptidase [Candidatus Parcubacteria bacterium]|nr:type I methionyl aminopeptidase [Candidatus Parcubacteria bacterium]